jgi:hypothetical protein
MARSHCPPWISSNVDIKEPRHGSALVGVGPPATPEHGSSVVGAENGGRSTGIPLRASPKLRRWCGGQAMAMKQWQRRNSAVATLKLWERGKREGVHVAKTGGGLLFLLGPEGGGRQWLRSNG